MKINSLKSAPNLCFWGKYATKINLNNFYHAKSPSYFLLCNITLPCDQREVWVDVVYWTIFVWVIVSEAIFWVSVGVGYFGLERHYFGWVGWVGIGGTLFWGDEGGWRWVGVNGDG